MSKHKNKIIVAVLSLVLLSGFIWFFVNKPKNIFEEIYRDEKQGMTSSFSSGVSLSKIKGIKSWSRYDAIDELTRQNPTENYDKDFVPKLYSDVQYAFAFNTERFTIFFTRDVRETVKLRFITTYSMKENILERKLSLLLNGQEIDNKQEIQKYLSDYHISKDDLESYYNEIMNKLVLKDWVSVYDSRFSPNDWGEVKVEERWN